MTASRRLLYSSATRVILGIFGHIAAVDVDALKECAVVLQLVVLPLYTQTSPANTMHGLIVSVA